MNKFYILLLLFFSQTVSFAQTVELEEVASGFTRPLALVHANDERVFIVEQDGKIFSRSAEGTNTLFLDIDDRVGSTQNEQGLLGLAFHPNHAENGFFFVSYTNNQGDSRISRFSVDSTNNNLGDPDSEEILLVVDQPYGNHNGGCIQFGPDGYLYIGFGDGGSAGDPQGYGQNRQSLLGKMLRIDIDNGDTYSIPSDNPFANDDFTLDEIWAIGVRNPWRFSFDKETGDLWMGDVGQSDWEEINLQLSSSNGGENYGWKCYEGNHPYSADECESSDELTYPVFEYSNTFTQGCSVTGGYVYRGTENPGLIGKYLYTDYCSGKLWILAQNDEGEWENSELLNVTNYNFGSFGENAAGELFLIGLDDGKIYKIKETCIGFTATGEVTDTTCEGDNDGSITIDAPDNSMTAWSNGESNTLTIDELAAGDYSVTITNTEGCEFTLDVTVGTTEILTAPTIAVDVNTLSVEDTYASYQWFLDGEMITGANSATFEILVDGAYSVEVTSELGCTAISNSVDMMFVSARDITSNALNVTLSPNPFVDRVALNIASEIGGQCDIYVKNILNQCVYKETIQINGNTLHFINFENIQTGIYFLEVSQINRKMVLKIAKQ